MPVGLVAEVHPGSGSGIEGESPPGTVVIVEATKSRIARGVIPLGPMASEKLARSWCCVLSV